MSKAFTSEETPADDEDDAPDASPLPAGSRNYMTPGGFARLRRELDALVTKERPELVATVAGRRQRRPSAAITSIAKRLREIDQRIAFSSGVDNAEVVDPAAPRDDDAESAVFFGATVHFLTQGDERTISIAGIDGIDTERGYINWISMARAPLRARRAFIVLRTPGGTEGRRRLGALRCTRHRRPASRALIDRDSFAAGHRVVDSAAMGPL
jgi:transcription elongation factor GreB